ncbi:hypothetical protein KX729_09055 [Rhizobium sp. XQZ8]|uniref:hypothetical protein n=1 Tax=Rhizobium populisoli TaxID=2859785 RepID=UPI001CA5E7EA|nr:hypothetical protein [Rhizobium populisoli]MBW6421586.1 hypothetical protein [Rhizobium populisoli]
MQTYWVHFVENDYPVGCQLGCGVTALDSADVRTVLAETLSTADYLDRIASIESVAYEDIEENHVRPNMGFHLRRGIWYPNGI